MPASSAIPTDPPTAPGSSFAELGVPSILTAVLGARGVTTPRPIQARSVPDGLAGRDVLGRAETGSGKTLAFGLPLLVRTATAGSQRTARQPRGLVLVPTRELADQVHDELLPLAAALGLGLLAVYGGVPLGRQIQQLRRGTDIVVATLSGCWTCWARVPARWTGSPSPCWMRPTTWPTWAFYPRSPHCWTASHPVGSGCCSRPPSTARSTPSSAAI